MDSYTPLLQKTRVPQPSLQKFAVISIFSKLRSAPSYLDPDSEPGREAISQCLHSTSPAVVDQSVRELCRLLLDSRLDLSRTLLELQSALEGSDPKFVGLFVKAIGYVVRFGFQRNHGSWRFPSIENHPFVKILLSRTEVQSELVQQVLLFFGQNRRLGMVEICEFLRPFLNFSILHVPFSNSSSSLFTRQLISSMASFCCSFPDEAIPVLKLLIGCLKHASHKNSDELRNSYYFLECIVDAYTVVLRHLVVTGSLVTEAQLFGVELSDSILSLLTCHHGHAGASEPIVELVKRLFAVQKDLSLQYMPEISSTLLSLFVVLIQSDLEYELLSLLKLLNFLLKWKSEKEYEVDRVKCVMSEELLFTFPVINLLSSTSRSIKGEAAELLVKLEKVLVELSKAPKARLATKGGFPPISSLGSIAYRLLQCLWFQILLPTSILNFASSGETDVKVMHQKLRPWASQLRKYILSIVDRRKSSLSVSQSQERFIRELPPLLCAITGVLVMHWSIGDAAIDLLGAIGIVDPKQGVPLLLAILFYSNIFTSKDTSYQNMLPKLLALLPSLASHSVMIPLIIQTILPMLQKDGKPVLYATGARLLCHTWAINDRAFGSLQAILLPKGLTEFKSERNILISLAASIRDVCRKNPDRGVDLILSVSACIENQDLVIKALGFQSLAHLCEADVIDFYTAWDVIGKHVVDYTTNPALAQSICLLLRWGAMDAEAYSEASRNVLQILWGIGTSVHVNQALEWARARIFAFEALSQYEVTHIQIGIPDFKRVNTELLLCETNLDVLTAMEGFQVKIITHEHVNRRRLVKEKKVAGSKIEKLLNVFPQALFTSGIKGSAGQLPGAALLCLSFTPKDVNSQRLSRVSLDFHAGYESALVEIAASLQLSRNIFIALLSLQSWKSFMQRWIRANIASLDAKAPSVSLDKTSKAATDILKSVMRLAEESIPSSAENIALAIGALCVVLAPSTHTVKSTASKFLLNWLFQNEHDHRQWSAAISLGLVSSCLHVTDHKQKLENITGLIKVLHGSKSILVKGACGLGLGFACQDLLTRVEAADNVDLDKEKYKAQEVDLLGKILRTLLLMTSQLSNASNDVLESLLPYFSMDGNDIEINLTSDQLLEKCDDLEEDPWGVAGLVLGLGISFNAIYRAGAHDAMLKIKDLIISWIPHVNSLVTNSSFSSEGREKALSVGSCLALPCVVAFCRRVEMINDNELDQLLKGYHELISELLSVKKSGTFHQSLMLASCVGVGSLLACILNEGVHPLEVESVKGLLEMFRKCYCSSCPPIICLGGMLGVVNSMGAGAGILVHAHHFSASIKTACEQEESSHILGPLLSSPICEPHLTTLVQEMFLIAQNSDDLKMQQNAAWAVSFLRNGLWSKELLNAERYDKSDVDSKTISYNFPEDNLVMKLTIWLMHLNNSGAGAVAHVGTVLTVLRCLSRAPRLPTVDWGLIIRRCMSYEAQVSEVLSPDSALKRGALREECVQFSIAHANQFDPLLTFLDELSDLTRFRTLELNLQSCLLFHLAGLIKVFSGSRIEKLFDDIAEYFCSEFLCQGYSPDQKSSLRISCWVGLYQCLEEAALSSVEYISNLEKCIEVLFHLLPASESANFTGVDLPNTAEEWRVAVQCLAKAQGDWLLDFLLVPLGDLVQGGSQSNEVLKKIQAKVKLVRMGSIPLTELGRLKAYMLNSKSKDIWNLLVEVVAALQYADGSFKRQWLVDAVEISCVSSYPSTALLFLGLLSGSCCKYGSLLTLDQLSLLSDLPVTLPSLVTEPSWEVVAESFVSSLWTSTERIYYWVTKKGLPDNTSSAQPIDGSEKDIASFLLHVMYHTCICLKEYLPLEKQLRLANMLVT
ncbi:protein RST [Salix suchowensis]|nr:protein RST [Salix suchowensis]